MNFGAANPTFSTQGKDAEKPWVFRFWSSLKDILRYIHVYPIKTSKKTIKKKHFLGLITILVG